MESSRLPRFKRSTAVPPIQLTARDWQIIRMVHRHRFLRSAHIVGLIGDTSQHLLRRLQLLYHHGLLERPRAQLNYYGKGGSHHMVYGLGSKGAAFLRCEFGIAIPKLRWGDKNRSVGRIFLQHALLVSEIVVGLELASRECGHVRLVSEGSLPVPKSIAHERRAFRWNVNLSKKTKLCVIPDRVFALDRADPNGHNDRAFFFLEADRGTMPVMRKNLSQTSFYRKLLAYEATWRQGIHEGRFGFHRFRVLTVTTSKKRLKSLLDACSQLKSGHGLFLFADRTILDKPTEILSALWQTGHGESTTLLN